MHTQMTDNSGNFWNLIANFLNYEKFREKLIYVDLKHLFSKPYTKKLAKIN